MDGILVVTYTQSQVNVVTILVGRQRMLLILLWGIQLESRNTEHSFIDWIIQSLEINGPISYDGNAITKM